MVNQVGLTSEFKNTGESNILFCELWMKSTK